MVSIQVHTIPGCASNDHWSYSQESSLQLSLAHPRFLGGCMPSLGHIDIAFLVQSQATDFRGPTRLELMLRASQSQSRRKNAKRLEVFKHKIATIPCRRKCDQKNYEYQKKMATNRTQQTTSNSCSFQREKSTSSVQHPKSIKASCRVSSPRTTIKKRGCRNLPRSELK